ncbi:MAG: exodeoxyribonuclease III [Bacteroidales bacterium]|jgi:exodeoxyribonuclease-3|nr:exodeoxyribonuclease III [Bacteroidales bacterium]MCK9449052.1 exodeoxyribonuclease III [Bacteroidales bacterium]MDD3702100.1 exodeoxyribonuclease III [Bacteroidales bacterium]MDY0369613.1 exodeoxyribonuclease III [Bacteroidales bacterium]
MKIITYNVNGIRAAINKGLLDWLAVEKPDVLCLQEIKAMYDQIPLLDFEALGYHHYWFSAEKKGYSGVALLSLRKPDKVVIGMELPQYDREGRLIRADFGELSVISVYHPSGSSGDERQAFKMQWLHDFDTFIEKLRKERPKLIVSGDYNICHQAIDIHDPIRNATVSGFLPEEREWMTQFLDKGFIDSFRQLIKEPHHYSWWSYRGNARTNNKGWRIDYNMLSGNLLPVLNSAGIMPQAVHSDHCPVWVELNV